MRWLSAAFLIFATCNASFAGLIIHGVRNFSAQGNPLLIGPVTISAGTGITLTQVGQNVAISSTNASVTANATSFTEFQMSGGVTIGNMGPPDEASGARTVSLISCTMRNSGDSGNNLIKLSYGPTLASSINITVTANSGLQWAELSTPGIVQAQHDYIDMEVTTAAFGAPDDLRCKIFY